MPMPKPKAAVAKAAAAKPQPKPAPSPAKPKESAEELEKLARVLNDIFVAYDEDQDGQIERVEFLETEERRIGRLDFGQKERKEAVAWFKESGAVGTPTDGMFLSRELFEKAYVDLARKESGILEGEAGKLADWLFTNRLVKVQKESPKPAEAPAPAAGAAVPTTPEPSYPITCALSQLAEKIREARAHSRSALILANGLSEVETFFSYQTNSLIDCKQILNEVFAAKTKTKEEWQQDLRGTLQRSMNSMGFCKPVHIRLANSAFDWTNFCSEQFPKEVFNCKLWTVEHAFQLGFFDEHHKMGLLIEEQKKWRDFHVLITSSFDLEKANEFLKDKIPFWEELAIISVDPASVA